MNKEWSELNKTMQAQIKKKDTYKMGIDTLFNLRRQLMQTLVSFKEDLCREDFNAIPFINADGYHSKTIAYSIWHIFRIEDIVAHTVITEDEQVFFTGNYQVRINSPIITTGNELVKQQIADFSKQLNLEELYSYIFEVRESTEKILERFSYDELKWKIPDERKGYLKSLNVVNCDEKAIWLHLTEGEIYTYTQLLQHSKKYLTKDVFDESCASCNWYQQGICKYEKLQFTPSM